MKIFLDSGAFSVWNNKKKINLQEYIDFCKKYQSEFDIIASLDVIPGFPNKKLTSEDVSNAAREGFTNYLEMKRQGILHEKLLHTFHQGDPDKYLERLTNKEESYIGISPANDRTTTQRKEWLDECMKVLLDSSRNPKVKFHGFAVTTLKLILNYPWYSVDSNSWRLRGEAYGMLDLPINPTLKKREDYYIQSIPISNGLKNFKKHTDMPALLDLEKISQKDCSLGKLPQYYVKKVEDLLLKYGYSFDELSDDYVKRSTWNALYLMESMNKLTKTTLFLASNSFKSVNFLCQKIESLGIDTKNYNILISYAYVRTSDGNKSAYLSKLFDLKQKFNENKQT